MPKIKVVREFIDRETRERRKKNSVHEYSQKRAEEILRRRPQVAVPYDEKASK